MEAVWQYVDQETVDELVGSSVITLFLGSFGR